MQPVLHLAHVPPEIDETNEDYNNLWLIAYSAQQAGIKTHMIPIDEVIFNEDTKSWEDAQGRRITNLFKLYPWEDLVTDSEAGYDKLLFAYHGAMDRWIEPAWKMFLSNSCCSPRSGISTPATRTSYPPTRATAAACATGFASPSSDAKATA